MSNQTANKAYFRDEGGKITVVGVTDNRRRRVKHWKIIGE